MCVDIAEIESRVNREGVTTKLLVEIEVALHVLRTSVKVVLGHPAAVQVLRCWLQRYLRPVLGVANYMARQHPPHLDTAIAVVNLLFTATVGLRDQSLENSKCALSLSDTDEKALVSFAIQCCRHASCPPLQSEAVKLLSAMFAVVPEWFAAENFAASALQALGQIQHIHPLAQCRALAGNVLAALSR
jgi:hypothetical protein